MTQSLSPDTATTVATSDGTVVLHFPQGAVVSDGQVSIMQGAPDGLPDAGNRFSAAGTWFTIDLAADLAPGATVTVTVKYGEAELEACGGRVGLLAISRYDEGAGQWFEMPTAVDPESMTLTVTTNRFSNWMVTVKTPVSTSTPWEAPLMPLAGGSAALGLLGVCLAYFRGHRHSYAHA
ncbi:MAG: hypothetical protein DRI39_10850 [Chloroflexi bacterium]|nr:MAG: hypothetical protein DRI39_10850 [Chloroflexota bacterium]